MTIIIGILVVLGGIVLGLACAIGLLFIATM